MSCSNTLSKYPILAVCASLGVFLSLTACDKATEPKESVNTNQDQTIGWREWFSKSTDTDWLKSQWSKGSEIAKSAKASLDSLKVDELSQAFANLKKAVESQDFTKVDEFANHLDKLLTTEKLAEGMRFVVIQRQQGGNAAAKAIEDYATRKDLGEFEKAAAENLKKGLTLLQREDLQGYTVLAIFFACECKLGAHQGGLLAVPIISILFPDYIERQGTAAKL